MHSLYRAFVGRESQRKKRPSGRWWHLHEFPNQRQAQFQLCRRQRRRAFVPMFGARRLVFVQWFIFFNEQWLIFFGNNDWIFFVKTMIHIFGLSFLKTLINIFLFLFRCFQAVPKCNRPRTLWTTAGPRKGGRCCAGCAVGTSWITRQSEWWDMQQIVGGSRCV